MVKVAFNQPGNMNIFVNKHQYATGDGLPAMSDFNFRDLEMTLKSHPRSKVMTHLTKSAMGNMFCSRHLWPTGNGLAAMGHFHFCDLEMTPQRSSKVKVIADSESLLPSSYLCS